MTFFLKVVLLYLCSLGVVITLLLKVLVTVIVGKETYAVFYKKRPLFGNLMSLAFEAWHTALTIWYVLTRSIKLAIITVIFLGRCDRPLLAQGVGMLGPLRKYSTRRTNTNTLQSNIMYHFFLFVLTPT